MSDERQVQEVMARYVDDEPYRRDITDFDAYQPPRRNYVYVLFNDPNVRALHNDWVEAASSAVATLRMEAAQDPNDPALATLVGELAVQHEDFRR